MARIKTWQHVNFITKKPTKGCQLCAKGAKVVIFITGECSSNCYYCPVSKYRRKDIIFADEQKLESLKDAIKEAKMISALGAGITGGEPTTHLTRVTVIIGLLKAEFGPKFHCHLYSSSALSQSQLLRLYHAGLDEIRFHPPMLKLTDKMRESIIMATEFDWSVGIEIPAIPTKEEQVRDIVEFAITTNLDFVNLNEFEFTEANFNALEKRGFRTKGDATAAVKGSEELALKILRYYHKSPLILHYCSSRYKDRIQLTNRLRRRAKNYARKFDIITTEGLIRRGYIKVKSLSVLEHLKSELEAVYAVPSYMLNIDTKKLVIITAEYIVRELAGEIKKTFSDDIVSIEVIEQYPFDDGIITYLEPII